MPRGSIGVMGLNAAQRQRIDDAANKLYDEYNPDQFVTINVSKEDCIKEVMMRMGFKTRANRTRKSR